LFRGKETKKVRNLSYNLDYSTNEQVSVDANKRSEIKTCHVMKALVKLKTIILWKSISNNTNCGWWRPLSAQWRPYS